MTLDQAIATLREFRLLRLGPELGEAIDCVCAELERNPFRLFRSEVLGPLVVDRGTGGSIAGGRHPDEILMSSSAA